jgi:hypothetical protein
MRGLENAGKTAGTHKTCQYDRFYKVVHLLDGWRNFYSGKALQCWEPTSPDGIEWLRNFRKGSPTTSKNTIP